VVGDGEGDEGSETFLDIGLAFCGLGHRTLSALVYRMSVE
jgi:hypothetical protein